MLTNRFETISAFRANLEERLRAEKKFQAAYQEEEKARLQNAVSLMPLLQGEDAGMIQVFMKQGVLFTYYEGDRVEGMGRDLLFVAEGKLVRSIEDSDGWYRTLGIAKEGTWLNETVMLEERKALLAAEVLSERATILAISKESMENILALYPNLWPKITAHAIAQLETFQRLWAQS